MAFATLALPPRLSAKIGLRSHLTLIAWFQNVHRCEFPFSHSLFFLLFFFLVNLPFFFSPFPLPAEGVSQSNHGSGPKTRRFYEKGEPKGLSNLKSKHSMGAVSGGAFEMSSSHIQRRDVMSSYHKHSIQSRARPLWARRINEQASWSTVERSHATFSLLLFELV